MPSILPGLFDYIQKVKLNGKMPGRRHGSKANIKSFTEEGRSKEMAEKVRDYGRLARDIIREAGGKENIANADAVRNQTETGTE